MKRKFALFVIFKKKFKISFSALFWRRPLLRFLRPQEHGWFNKSENLSTVCQTGRQ